MQYSTAVQYSITGGITCVCTHRRLTDKRVVILDWDIHHGNGTQHEFYSDPEVLYISIHRHDNGNFFPGTGAPGETGEWRSQTIVSVCNVTIPCCAGAAPGEGRTVNIAWSSSQQPLGDAEYLAAMRTLVTPIIKMFGPALVLVSAGFDAASGHPATIGGYNVSPACFAAMTASLAQLAEGKVRFIAAPGSPCSCNL